MEKQEIRDFRVGSGSCGEPKVEYGVKLDSL
jgi:hypothetical protein